MTRILYMLRKEFLQILRDRPMMAIVFVVPVIQLVILSFAITTEVRHIRLSISDLDRSRLSREVVRAFTHADRFDVVETTSDLARARSAMKAWQVQLSLVIPRGFGRDLVRGLTPAVQLVADGVDGNSAGIAVGYARGILSELAPSLMADRAGAVPRPVHLALMVDRMWYNPDLSSQQYMVPGIVVVLLTILPMMLSAMSLVKEQEIGTLEQLLVTPLRKHQLLLGKLVPFLLLSYVELALVTAVAVSLFRIPMAGSYALLAGLALVYLFTTLGLGIFISTVARSQQQAMFIAWFFMVFMILLSGFFIPIENMPQMLQKITYLNPMRYFMSITRDIFQKGSGLRFLVRDAIPLACFGLVISTMGVLKFRKHVG